jgi:putative hydrolase of the HAD superfamily
VRAVIFDFFGTLTDPRAEIARESVYAETARALGVAPARFWAEMTATFRDRITGKLGGTAATLRAVAVRCGAAPGSDQVDEAVRVHLRGAKRLAAPRAGALETLDELRGRGFRLGLISDCSSELAECWTATQYSARFDAVVLSWQQRCRKPDPRLYARAVALLGVPPEECWYAGDGGGRELTGAMAAGMTPILVTNAAVPAAAAHRSDPDEHVARYVIDELAALLPLVGTGRCSQTRG